MFIEQACQILGVNVNDTDLENTAKKAYRKLAKELHPDKTGNTDTSNQFSQVTDAYNAITEFIKNPVVHQPTVPGFHVDFGGFNVTTPNKWNVSVSEGARLHHTVDEHGNVHFTISYQ